MDGNCVTNPKVGNLGPHRLPHRSSLVGRSPKVVFMECTNCL